MTVTPDFDAPDGVPRLEPYRRPPELDPALRSSNPLLEISNATVRAYKAAFGRGPTHARTRFAGTDTLVVLLQDMLTVSERNLAALGEFERLRQHRLLVHQVAEPEIRAAVERILDRPTLGLISGIDPHRDVAAEVITLAPVPIPDPELPPKWGHGRL
jgi:uncharacterized protein YbcI